ncbi:MAG: response regulator transcription factor [Verrucomicrobiales bacterium]|nr:response regulator transcription factor [Verrucomicrobiales bacterium]
MADGSDVIRITVVTVEDDTSYTAVLRRVLEGVGDFTWGGSFINPVRFLTALPDLRADVFLLDIHMPRLSGLECIREIKQCLPDARVLMISVHDDDDYVLKAFLDGADGYLLKDSSPDQIVEAIHDARRGGAPMSPSIARKVVGILGRLQAGEPTAKAPASAKAALEALSLRETEVLDLLAKGRRYTEIASEISVSLDTVKTHIRNIYRKLEVRNKAEAISLLLG